jgi:hypothetical protein
MKKVYKFENRDAARSLEMSICGRLPQSGFLRISGEEFFDGNEEEAFRVVNDIVNSSGYKHEVVL